MFYLLLCVICISVQRHLAVSFSYPKCWHDISNTNIYIQLIHIPKMYILPTLCPKGTQKLSNLHSSPKCWHEIYRQICLSTKHPHCKMLSFNYYWQNNNGPITRIVHLYYHVFLMLLATLFAREKSAILTEECGSATLDGALCFL